jgi:hypothetical protein
MPQFVRHAEPAAVTGGGLRDHDHRRGAVAPRPGRTGVPAGQWHGDGEGPDAVALQRADERADGPSGRQAQGLPGGGGRRHGVTRQPWQARHGVLGLRSQGRHDLIERLCIPEGLPALAGGHGGSGAKAQGSQRQGRPAGPREERRREARGPAEGVQHRRARLDAPRLELRDGGGVHPHLPGQGGLRQPPELAGLP